MTIPAPALSDLPASLMQPQFAFFLVIGVLWLFKAIAKAKAAFLSEERPQPGADRPGPATQPGPVEASLSDEERALLVRQDILQKRAKRQAEAAALMRIPSERTAPAPPPLEKRTSVDVAAATAKRSAPKTYTRAQPAAAVPSQAPAALPVGALAAYAPAPSPGAAWLEELRNRDSVRRAVLLREILGQPVALR